MRTLIVDDNFINRNYLLKLLQPLGECDVAVNGTEAVDAYRNSLETKELYDLICMDLKMPEMDGHEALSQIRDIEKDKGVKEEDQIKIIMTTAINDHKSILESFRYKCKSYLVKPIMKDQLYQELEKLKLITTAQSDM